MNHTQKKCSTGITTSLLAILAALFCSGCASTGSFKGRSHDLADIATVQLGYGLGAKLRAGPLHTGASWIFTPVGLSNGEFYGPAMMEETCPADVEVITHGVEFSPRGMERNKNYGTKFGSQPLPFLMVPEDTDGTHPFYTELRLAAGIGPAAVLGLNPGELLDFVLGFVGADIYGDDTKVVAPQTE